MSPRTLPHAILASTVALAVAAGPLAAAADAQAGNGSDWNNGWADAQPSNGPKDPKGPKGPTGGQDDPKTPEPSAYAEPDGAYNGAVVTTSSDTSSKPTAQPLTAFQMPFPCGEVWTGSTRAGHSPSARSVDFNRADDFQDPVVAAAGGVVTTAVTGKKRPSYGQFVVIDHGNSESTLYGHLDSVTVVVGQTVSAGTQIGTVGNTGNSHGAHLHFEERKGSSVIDPWFSGARYFFGVSQQSQNCGQLPTPDVPLAGNMGGDKRAELVVYRRTGTPGFHVRRTAKAERVIRFGGAVDQPVLGDWNGDGRVSPGVRLAGTRKFWLKTGRVPTEIVFGSRRSDIAIAGNWDGAGAWEVGVRRATSNVFRLRMAEGKVVRVTLGDVDDIPVTGDWDGDGITDLGVYDSATAIFTLRMVDDNGIESLSQVIVGKPGDLPVVGDWDANGLTDLGVWEPDTAVFHLRTAPSPTMNMKGKAKFERTRFGIGR